MPAGTKTINFDEYRLHHNCCGCDFRITIVLHGIGDVGYLRSYPKGQVPISTWMQDLGRFNFCFEIDRYPEFIGTLRYEKPLSMYVNWDEKYNITYAEMSTSMEPVGEQEGV